MHTKTLETFQHGDITGILFEAGDSYVHRHAISVNIGSTPLLSKLKEDVLENYIKAISHLMDVLVEAKVAIDRRWEEIDLEEMLDVA